MMGVSHALSGLAVGAGAVVVLDVADAIGPVDIAVPIPVTILAVALVGGGALLPDIDHHSSTAARALGPITKLLARAIDALSLAIYHATRTAKDPAARESGHRLITHTPVGSAAFGLLAWVACSVSQWGAAVLCGLVVGLLGAGTKASTGKLLKSLAGIRLSAAMTLALAGGVSGYLVSGGYPGWSWLYGVAVFAGCLIHREGDWCTNSGVPRRLWPKLKNGCRWDKHRAPATFDTGEYYELRVVRPVLLGGFLVNATLATGILQPVAAHVFPLLIGNP